MDSFEIICNTTLPPIGFIVGYNIGTFEKTLRKLSEDPFRREEYEKFLKNKKNNSTRDFVEYYFGMPGRFFAYRYMDNPKNWK